MNYTDSYAPNIVLIAVDNYCENDFSGRIYTKYDREPLLFASSLDLLLKLEIRYDEWAFPESAVAYRDFRSRRGPKPAHPRRQRKPGEGERLYELSQDGRLPEETGKLATIVMECQQRLHADWAGIFWLDQENESQSFNSALDLLRALDDYISTKSLRAGALWT